MFFGTWPFIWGKLMEGLPPSSDYLLIGFVAFGLALALLITGIQRAVRVVRRMRESKARRHSGGLPSG
jgi:hypothetical protein